MIEEKNSESNQKIVLGKKRSYKFPKGLKETSLDIAIDQTLKTSTQAEKVATLEIYQFYFDRILNRARKFQPKDLTKKEDLKTWVKETLKQVLGHSKTPEHLKGLSKHIDTYVSSYVEKIKTSKKELPPTDKTLGFNKPSEFKLTSLNTLQTPVKLKTAGQVTEDEIKEVKKMLEEDKSSSEIEKTLGFSPQVVAVLKNTKRV